MPWAWGRLSGYCGKTNSARLQQRAIRREDNQDFHESASQTPSCSTREEEEGMITVCGSDCKWHIDMQAGKHPTTGVMARGKP